MKRINPKKEEDIKARSTTPASEEPVRAYTIEEIREACRTHKGVSTEYDPVLDAVNKQKDGLFHRWFRRK